MCTNNTNTNCGCHQAQNPCECEPEVCGGCAVKDLSTECSLYDQDDIKCGEITVIPKNTVLSLALKKIVDWVCSRLSEIQSNFTLVNVGTGSSIYKGINLLGEKEIRKLNALGDLVTVTQNTNDISVSIDEAELENFVENLLPNYNASNVGTGAGIYKDEVTNTFRFKTLKSSDNSISRTVNTDDIDLKVENLQKVVSAFPYTLTSADDKYTIFVDNGVSAVTINVPNGLVNNFSCVFIQKGTGDVTIAESGSASLEYPSVALQNKIKGQFYWAMVEKELATNTYYLLGSLKLV